MRVPLLKALPLKALPPAKRLWGLAGKPTALRLGPLGRLHLGKPNTHKVPNMVPAPEQVSKVKLFSLKDFDQKIMGCMLKLWSLAPRGGAGSLGETRVERKEPHDRDLETADTLPLWTTGFS